MISNDIKQKKHVYGIVVSYNPDKELFSHLQNLTNQVSKIILFDNNSTEEYLQFVNQCESIKNVDIIYSKSNVGLSKAQNIAIKMALKEGAEWILTLDDDSNLSDDFVDNMLSVYKDSNLNVGVLVPIVKDINSNQVSKFILSGNKFRKVSPSNIPLEVLVAICSGMLVKADVFQKIGFMNEDYFIDYIDIDFSLRVNSHFKIITSPNSFLFHRLGDKTIIKVLFLSFVVSNHSPFRRYYIYRNRIILWRKFFSLYPKYIIYEILVSLVEAAKILLLEANKRKNILFIIRGVIEGIKK